MELSIVIALIKKLATKYGSTGIKNIEISEDKNYIIVTLSDDSKIQLNISDFMSKEVFDTNKNNIVDDSEKLQGKDASYFENKIDENKGNISDISSRLEATETLATVLDIEVGDLNKRVDEKLNIDNLRSGNGISINREYGGVLTISLNSRSVRHTDIDDTEEANLHPITSITNLKENLDNITTQVDEMKYQYEERDSWKLYTSASGLKYAVFETDFACEWILKESSPIGIYASNITFNQALPRDFFKTFPNVQVQGYGNISNFSFTNFMVTPSNSYNIGTWHTFMIDRTNKGFTQDNKPKLHYIVTAIGF